VNDDNQQVPADGFAMLMGPLLKVIHRPL